MHRNWARCRNFQITALFTALTALQATRKYQLIGGKLAKLAAAVAVGSILTSPAWHFHLYRSETLAGHIRTKLVTSKTTNLDSYDGKSICLKGYSLYFGGDAKPDTFLLSPDGNFRKPETAITVEIPQSWQQQRDPIAVSGVLRVDRNATDPSRRYTLSAVKITNARNSHFLAPRFAGEC